MPLTLTDCKVTKHSIEIFFSDAVNASSKGDPHSAINPKNYTIYAPPAIPSPTSADDTKLSATMEADQPSDTSVIIKFKPTAVAFRSGNYVIVTIQNVALASAPDTNALEGNTASIAGQVPVKGKAARLTRDVEDAIAYPILTEEIGYRPSPVALSGAMPPAATGGGTSLGQVAAKAVSDVLGWKVNPTDSKGFMGALTHSFSLTDVEGHVEAKWTPRTYAVQTDLAGGITGAQASLYARAKEALSQCVPLLDGLYALDPEAEEEYVKALREMAKSQMNEIVKQLGNIGGPSVLRVDTYFKILLWGAAALSNPVVVPTDADNLNDDSTLGLIRDIYGIQFAGNSFSNSIDDEQDITNFRIIVDYFVSLWQSWLNNKAYFLVGSGSEAFFGTQLVLISRQFSVIAETVNEVRFALDSVFIGPSERQTLLLEFADGSPAQFLEGVLLEIEGLVTEEGPRLIRDGGRIAVNNNLLPVVEALVNLVEQSHSPLNLNSLPDGFKTARVQHAFDDLADQMQALADLIKQVARDVPPPEGRLFVFPPSVDFGDVLFDPVNPQTVTQTVTVANLSSSGISKVTAEIEDKEAFKVSDEDLGPLQPNATTSVSVTFSPPDIDEFSDTLTITADQKTIEIPLSGVGKASEGSLLVFPPSVDFGEVSVDQKVTQMVTLANLSNTDIANMRVTQEDPQNVFSHVFKEHGAVGVSALPAMTTISIPVIFSPKDTDKFSGTLTINADQQTIHLDLQGTGKKAAAAGHHP